MCNTTPECYVGVQYRVFGRKNQKRGTWQGGVRTLHIMHVILVVLLSLALLLSSLDDPAAARATADDYFTAFSA
eukprot:909760-Prorocentrum_minimum.AAC.2